MKPIGQLVAELRHAKVRIWEEGDQVRYKAPRDALTLRLLAEMGERKGELLEFCRRAKARPGGLSLGPRPQDAGAIVSTGQRRLWILDQVQGPSATYNIALAMRMRGALDVDALQLSLAAIMRRHEPLQTSFQARGDDVIPIIVAALPPPLPVVDLQDLPEDRRLSEARRQAHEGAARPFDLSRGPLVRFVLWKLGGRDHILLMNVHHIVFDGRSIEILTGELAAFYASYRDGRDAGLPEIRIQYSDFAYHQQQWLTDAVLETQLDYWRQQLAGLPPLLELPTDRPRPPAFTSHGANLRSVLDAGLLNPLKQLARQSSATLYMTLMAGVAAFLSSYTGREDIPIGCPVTRRNQPELERLIGFFVNTLVLRIDLSGNPTFRDLLARTRAVVMDGFSHQDVPFEKVVETVIRERNTGYPPLVQFTMMMLDGADRPGSTCPAWRRSRSTSTIPSPDSICPWRCTSPEGRWTSSGSTTPTCSTGRPSRGWRGTWRTCSGPWRSTRRHALRNSSSTRPSVAGS